MVNRANIHDGKVNGEEYAYLGINNAKLAILDEYCNEIADDEGMSRAEKYRALAKRLASYVKKDNLKINEVSKAKILLRTLELLLPVLELIEQEGKSSQNIVITVSKEEIDALNATKAADDNKADTDNPDGI